MFKKTSTVYITACVTIAILAFVAVPQAVAQTPKDPIDPWSEIAVDDLHFIRAILRENHAGPADTLNPWFRDWYEKGFTEALALARRARDYPGYYFAIQYFMQGFQDGHLGALGEALLENTRLQFRWPGFIVGYRAEQFQVVASENQQIPVGATLIACDGRSTEVLGRTILQTYHGLWSVPGARSGLAPLLFVDAGNPFMKPLNVCTWRVRDKKQKLQLAWRPINTDTLQASIQNARRQISPPFAVRRFANDSGYWISLPSFALGSKKVREGLDSVRTVLERDGDLIRASQIIVIDVRGNSGGSSSLGDEIVETLWGSAVLKEARPRGMYVDWRVSAGNARFLRRVNLARLGKRYGAEDPDVSKYRTFVEAMEAAVARGEVFYRSVGNKEATTFAEKISAEGTRYQVDALVFFLTDHACFSACLDFADLLRRIPGVVHIGLETRADAVYIDNRSERLPSGLGRVGFSMKVYRNRLRGHNESYIPQHVWQGDISDNVALERWILNLAKNNTH